MEATVSVICNKFKVLKNGESPIMVRVAKDGKRSIGKAFEVAFSRKKEKNWGNTSRLVSYNQDIPVRNPFPDAFPHYGLAG